jgi:hypothetical protein
VSLLNVALTGNPINTEAKNREVFMTECRVMGLSLNWNDIHTVETAVHAVDWDKRKKGKWTDDNVSDYDDSVEVFQELMVEMRIDMNFRWMLKDHPEFRKQLRVMINMAKINRKAEEDE